MIISSNFSTTQKRIELKDVFRIRDRLLLEQAIILSKFSFRRSFPDRIVNSIYYDTFNYKSLEESLEGESIRKKSRVRWYGPNDDESEATLEIKLKQGHLSWKKLYHDSFTICPKAKKWNLFLQSNYEADFPRYYLKNLLPRSIVTYKRSYYSSFDNKIRITIDQDLKTFNQHSLFDRNLEYKRKHENVLILEIKVDNCNETMLKKVLEDLPFSPKRFSKYCESIIPSNRDYVM